MSDSEGVGLLDHAADYDQWLKMRDRRALRFLTLMATIVMLSLFAIAGIGKSDRPETRALAFFIVLAAMTVFVFVFARQINFYFKNPHRFELQLGELDTPELIHAQSMLVGRAKSRATTHIWIRASAHKDEQARAYLSGGDWEGLPSRPAVPHDQVKAAINPNALEAFPGWARWAWGPFLVSTLVTLLAALLLCSDFVRSLVTGNHTDGALIVSVTTYSFYVSIVFAAILVIGNMARETRLSRLPTEQLILEWLGGNIEAAAFLKRRTKSDPKARALAERCGWM